MGARSLGGKGGDMIGCRRGDKVGAIRDWDRDYRGYKGSIETAISVMERDSILAPGAGRAQRQSGLSREDSRRHGTDAAEGGGDAERCT